jgi:TetR/AcrR family transcriptional regulator, repressor of fatR-cypB operon
MYVPAYISADDAPAKKKILISALKLFSQRGLCETTVRDISDDSGYTNPALFKHFESKEALALYLFENCYLWLYQAASRALAGHEAFEEKQRAVIAAFVHALHEDPAAVLFAQENLRHFWPSVNPAIRKHSILGLIRQMLDEGRRHGAVTAEVEIEILTVAWMGTVQQFARVWSFGGFKKKEAEIAAQLDTVLMRAVSA